MRACYKCQIRKACKLKNDLKFVMMTGRLLEIKKLSKAVCCFTNYYNY